MKKNSRIPPIQETRFVYKGYPCVVLMQTMGFRTGYVGLPKGHEYYEVDYDLIPIECHWGLTYSSNSLYHQNDKDTWWIGYDCGHYGDGFAYEEAIELFKDYPTVVDRLTFNMENFPSFEPAKSLLYCINECKNIVDQLEENNNEPDNN